MLGFIPVIRSKSPTLGAKGPFLPKIGPPHPCGRLVEARCRDTIAPPASQLNETWEMMHQWWLWMTQLMTFRAPHVGCVSSQNTQPIIRVLNMTEHRTSLPASCWKDAALVVDFRDLPERFLATCSDHHGPPSRPLLFSWIIGGPQPVLTAESSPLGTPARRSQSLALPGVLDFPWATPLDLFVVYRFTWHSSLDIQWYVWMDMIVHEWMCLGTYGVKCSLTHYKQIYIYIFTLSTLCITNVQVSKHPVYSSNIH